MAYRPGISALIIATLIASAMVRLGINSDVFAKEMKPPTPEGSDVYTTKDACPAPQAPLSLLQAIQEQKQSLETREDRLANRMKALELAEASLKQQEEDLIVAEERLAATLALADDAAENDLKKLTNVYETMKPKAAAALFSEMAPEFAAEHVTFHVYDWSNYTIEVDETLAFATFDIRMEYEVRGEARERDAHGTALLVRSDDGWKIRHLHTS